MNTKEILKKLALFGILSVGTIALAGWIVAAAWPKVGMWAAAKFIAADFMVKVCQAGLALSLASVTAALVALYKKVIFKGGSTPPPSPPPSTHTNPHTRSNLKMRQRENPMELNYQENGLQGKQPVRRRFLGRNPARLIARWHSRKTQQKQNQRAS